MPSGKSLEDMGAQIAEASDEMEKLISAEFTGLGPYTHKISDKDYPIWYEGMRQKAYEEQLKLGITGWTWPDGQQTMGWWDRVLSSGAVEGGVDEHKRYLRTKLAQVTGVQE